MKLKLVVVLTLAGLLSGCSGFSNSGQSSSSVKGSSPTPHSVNLWWEASTSAGIAGYNVYRAPYTDSCGSYAKINTSLITSTSYTDADVTSGGSYCYATTAVNASRQESGYSNVIINVQIPTS